MAKRLIVRGEEAEIIVELDEGPVARELWDRLPLETSATLWGGGSLLSGLASPGD